MVKKPIERTCIIRRDIVSPDEAIRLVVSPEGELFYDLKGNLPMRGYWLTASREYFESLLANSKKLRQMKVTKMPSADFMDNLIKALENQIMGQLGLARRAGQLVFGFEKIKIWLKENEPSLALVAKNGSQKEMNRLGLEHYNIAVFRLLTKEQQGLALGREHIVHIILKSGKLAQTINKNCLHLAGLVANE
ncbi:MAG: DUF448 domain-containing protein [Alphaproteobacteria bacterium]